MSAGRTPRRWKLDAPRHGVSATAVAWTLAWPGVTAAIVGGSRDLTR